MKKYILSLIFLGCLVFTGCSESNEPMPSFSYVETYLLADTIHAYQLQGNYTDIIAVRFEGEEVSMLSYATLEQFEPLAKLYNDISYTGVVIPPGSNKALSSSLESVNVTCNQDFDTEHKAGQPLNDIIKLLGGSPYDFIQNGYKDYTPPNAFPDYWYSMTRLQSVGYKPIELLLSTVNSDNTKMLYPICYLQFTKIPLIKGDYTFAIKMKLGENEINSEFSASF